MSDQVYYHRVSDSPDLTLSEGSFSNFRFEPHYHIDFHVGLVIQGVQEQKVAGEKVLLGPGRVVVMPPGEVHDGITYQGSDYKLNTFRITPEMLDQSYQDIFDSNKQALFSAAMLEDNLLSAQLSALFFALKQGGSLSSLPVEEEWLKVMNPILGRLSKTREQDIKGGLSQRHWSWVQEFCRENMSEKMTLAQLADITGLSRYQLLRRFEKNVGLTPHNWLTQLRLEYACRRMRCSDDNIASIASEVGFYDQSHFNRAFKNAYGVAPSRY
ncbi:AraC family transcriptional regulator [Vibrio sp. SCSIO 43137]|uniref:AraC family transcriptional regulator n=1 Tax=Vibrio sp. SCSIO 43137 TaxID=3021011 RepID=UPI002307C0C6|nr:AraC family transcriptional regulator [Vibrio sp. SCSIO 43137]WCE32329.1 AraC family transcriptional regulator [Vibrio sp. SCSIO 43137]